MGTVGVVLLAVGLDITGGRPFHWYRDRPIYRSLEEGCRSRACLDFESARAALLAENMERLRQNPHCYPPTEMMATCVEGGHTLSSCDRPGDYVCHVDYFDENGRLVDREFSDYEGRTISYGDHPRCTEHDRKDLCTEAQEKSADTSKSHLP